MFTHRYFYQRYFAEEYFTPPVQTYNEVGSGGMVCGGSPAIWARYRPTITGGVSCNSSAPIRARYRLTTTGGVLTSGIGLLPAIYHVTASGGAKNNSSAVVSVITSRPVSGGAKNNSSATIRLIYKPTITGGTLTNGTSIITHSPPITGGILCNGSPSIKAFYNITPIGGAKNNGTSTINCIYTDTPTGGVETAGNILTSFFEETSGGMETDGTATLYTFIIGLGGVLCNSSSSNQATYNITAQGGVSTNGTSSLAGTHYGITPTGGILANGIAINTAVFSNNQLYLYNELTDDAIVPPHFSIGSGYVQSSINIRTRSTSVIVNHFGLGTVTSITINGPASESENADPIASFPLGNPVVLKAILSQEVFDGAIAGEFYLLISTTSFPDGELRAQFKLTSDNYTSVCGGSAIVSVVRADTSSHTGGVRCNSSATLKSIYQPPVTGGAKNNSTSSVIKTTSLSITGGTLANGTTPNYKFYNHVVTGGAICNSSSTVRGFYTLTTTGGVECNGEANSSVISGIIFYEASGSVTTSGESFCQYGPGWIATGSVSISGTYATAYPTIPHTPSNLNTTLIRVSGSAEITVSYGNIKLCPGEFQCGFKIPTRYADCVPPNYYSVEYRRSNPRSRRDSIALLPAVTVCRQKLYLPEESAVR